MIILADSRKKIPSIIAAAVALAGLAVAWSSWGPDGVLGRDALAGIQFPAGMILGAVALLVVYRLLSGPMFVPKKAAHAHYWPSGGREPFRRDDEGGSLPPGAGRPAPLQPRPGHHLSAAKFLPPGDSTHLFPKD